MSHCVGTGVVAQVMALLYERVSGVSVHSHALYHSQCLSALNILLSSEYSAVIGRPVRFVYCSGIRPFHV